LMKEVRGRFTERIQRTPTVVSFRFATQEKIDFLPGQFLQVIFNQADRADKNLNKHLSFSCAPGKDYIEVTKRLSQSDFSQRLQSLKNGDEVLFKAPLGTCIFKDEYQKIGFLIGGIGITPVISIIEYIMEKKLGTSVCLVYSNRNDEEIAFRQELDRWRGVNNNLRISYLVTDCQPKDQVCIFGTINKDLLKEKICDFQERLFFVFGPPKMVESMDGLCRELGCPRENVKIENFTGY